MAVNTETQATNLSQDVLNKLVNIQRLREFADRSKTEMNVIKTLADEAQATADLGVKSVVYKGSKVYFYTVPGVKAQLVGAAGVAKENAEAEEATIEPIGSIDIPQEQFLQQTETGLFMNFHFAAWQKNLAMDSTAEAIAIAEVYDHGVRENVTDPELEGKPVFVMGVKAISIEDDLDDSKVADIEEAVSYSFLDMTTLYADYASGSSIVIDGQTINVVVAENENPNEDGTEEYTAWETAHANYSRADKFVTMDADGHLKDSEVKVADEVDVTRMLNEIFGNLEVEPVDPEPNP